MSDRPTRSAAIHAFCLECVNYQRAEIRRCPDEPCPLWEFRMGPGQTERTERAVRSDHTHRPKRATNASRVSENPLGEVCGNV